MTDSNVVRLNPVQKARPRAKHGDEKLADDVRKAHRKLCKAIDAATFGGLKVELLVDSNDTLSGGRVRGRDPTITKRL